MKPIFLENNFLGKNWKGERKCHLGLGVTNSVGFLKKRVKIDIEERESRESTCNAMAKWWLEKASRMPFQGEIGH